MVDHFHAQVIGRHKIGGKARAMVVTKTIARAIDYYEAIRDYLVERGSPYKAIVAFSEFERNGHKVTEAHYNRFPGGQILDKIREDPYRILVVADKFQTGYDEPLLHTMYVDKPLSGVLAVQTLSRLNRAMPGKTDTAVLDFANTTNDIRAAFQNYYRTTTVAGETDPDKLHDLASDLFQAGVFSREHVEVFVTKFLSDADRAELNPILDECVAEYIEELDDDEQVEFKSLTKAFIRTYSFLSLILPYNNPDWEGLAIFLSMLAPKQPAPREDDLSAGILETIDMDSYRIEKREQVAITLDDQDGEFDPVPTGGGGGVVDPELARLSRSSTSSTICSAGSSGRTPTEFASGSPSRYQRRSLPTRATPMLARTTMPTTRNSPSILALQKVMQDMLRNETQLFKQFADNPGFKAWLANAIFKATYNKRIA